MGGNHKEFTVVFWLLHVFLVLLLFSALNKPQLVQSVLEACSRGFAVWWEEPYVHTSPLAEEWHFFGGRMKAGSHLLGAARQYPPYKPLWLLICLDPLKSSFNISAEHLPDAGFDLLCDGFKPLLVCQPFSGLWRDNKSMTWSEEDCFSMNSLQEKFTIHRTHNSNWVKNTWTGPLGSEMKLPKPAADLLHCWWWSIPWSCNSSV